MKDVMSMENGFLYSDIQVVVESTNIKRTIQYWHQTNQVSLLRGVSHSVSITLHCVHEDANQSLSFSWQLE